jgi:CubicO group peptidase (beta-lactamase class C family)
MTTGLREGTAAEAGLSERQLDHVNDLAAEWVKDGIHPALVVLVARHGVIALHDAFGQLGPEVDDPALARNALFPLASVGKLITATALMTFVEEGRVGLTRAVSDYLPEFSGEGKDGVKVHHLLTHTSGIRSPWRGDEFANEVISRLQQPQRDSTLDPIADAILQIAYEQPLSIAPGTEMYYDSVNYELLGEIVRCVSGRSLRDVIHERIFAPLGMNDSQVTVPPELAGRVVRATAESPEAGIWALPILDTAVGAGLGMHSTALDMATFGQAFLDGGRGRNGRILGPATAAEMVRNQIPGTPGELLDERHDEASWGYGWGIVCHEKWNYFPTHPAGTFQHGGASGVYLWCDPANALVGAFFAAATKDLRPEQLWWQADLFANAVTAAIED